jgi:hypothetical protein
LVFSALSEAGRDGGGGGEGGGGGGRRRRRRRERRRRERRRSGAASPLGWQPLVRNSSEGPGQAKVGLERMAIMAKAKAAGQEVEGWVPW